MHKSLEVTGRYSKAMRNISLRLAAVFALLALYSGCGTTLPPVPPSMATKVAPDVQVLNPGDVIKISFPGAPNLETTQQIRRDGRINPYMIGEVKASEKTPAELEKELRAAYSSQLQDKEVKVTVVSSAFVVYVMGAVARPGKITPDRSITAFEAIMEAGGFDPSRANIKDVRVIRQEGGQMKTYPINMKGILDGAQTEPFYLKPFDTIYIPEKVSWF